ncbi:hypothetical protein [Cyanothece sp. BG0011]|uniref:hypothetical protein n=1 Tax=Cyanothece sp. BG0011 TaxID=2082950 RepID=UPI000D1EE88D|nr:hypothetical protein [Cyanothece sp. BG0011]
MAQLFNMNRKPCKQEIANDLLLKEIKMMNNFGSILNQISKKVMIELEKKFAHYNQADSFTKLNYGIYFWCKRLDISDKEYDFIIQGVKNNEIKKLIDFIFKESLDETKSLRIRNLSTKESTTIQIKNEFYQQIKDFFLSIRSGLNPMRLIILLAFGITAIGYFVYKLKESEQKPENEFKKNNFVSYPSSSPVSSSVSPTITTPVKPTFKQSLILVIPAAQVSVIETLQVTKKINYDDGKKLYQLTQYLYQGKEESIKPQWNSIKQFETQSEEVNEYDIYLIKIDLKETEEGFKPTVNQVDRHDAFNKLYDLATNVEVSSRLKMDAASIFDVYNR